MKTILVFISTFVFTSTLYSQEQKATLDFNDKHFIYNDTLVVNTYTPIINVLNEFFDTINVFEFSRAMMELELQNLYLNTPDFDIIRLSRFTHEQTTIIELESKDDLSKIRMTTCSGKYFNLNIESKIKVETQLSSEEYFKLKNRLKTYGLWGLDNSSFVVPREYIFESVINGEYFYRYKGELDLSGNKQNKNLIKLFDKLEKNKKHCCQQRL